MPHECTAQSQISDELFDYLDRCAGSRPTTQFQENAPCAVQIGAKVPVTLQIVVVGIAEQIECKFRFRH